MSRQRPLRGSCSCGRNQYIVTVPTSSTERAQVLFDRGSASRRHLATPLSAWLRVPLDWYRSSTYAFYDDETHASIRRVFTPPASPFAKRQFCGYCGTPLSYWTESPRAEANYISLTLGSLLGEDLAELEDLGLLPSEAVDDALEEKGMDNQRRERIGQAEADAQQQGSEVLVKGAEENEENADEEEDVEGEVQGGQAQVQDQEQLPLSSRVFEDDEDDDFFFSDNLPWFDSLLQGSRLSRLAGFGTLGGFGGFGGFGGLGGLSGVNSLSRLGGGGSSSSSRQPTGFGTVSRSGSGRGKGTRTTGQARSRDGNVRMEWEISEWNDGDDDDDEADDGGHTPSNTGKRKLVEIEDEDDGKPAGGQRNVAMRQSRDA